VPTPAFPKVRNFSQIQSETAPGWNARCEEWKATAAGLSLKGSKGQDPTSTVARSQAGYFARIVVSFRRLPGDFDKNSAGLSTI